VALPIEETSTARQLLNPEMMGLLMSLFEVHEFDISEKEAKLITLERIYEVRSH
jgi:hypothetical protein